MPEIDVQPPSLAVTSWRGRCQGACGDRTSALHTHTRATHRHPAARFCSVTFRVRATLAQGERLVVVSNALGWNPLLHGVALQTTPEAHPMHFTPRPVYINVEGEVGYKYVVLAEGRQPVSGFSCVHASLRQSARRHRSAPLEGSTAARVSRMLRCRAGSCGAPSIAGVMVR